MYKGTELPKNYNELTLAQKEAIWLGTLLVYEDSDNFDLQYWCDEIFAITENVIFEDDELYFYKSYNDYYCLVYKKLDDGIKGDFSYFFFDTFAEKCERLWRLGDDYKEWTLRDYIRSKGFPVTTEFWE
jgi:hypothetical protein